MSKPIYIWERAIKDRPDISFTEFKLTNHLVTVAFGYCAGGSRGHKIPVKWTCDGLCFLRYTSRRYPDADLNIRHYD